MSSSRGGYRPARARAQGPGSNAPGEGHPAVRKELCLTAGAPPILQSALRQPSTSVPAPDGGCLANLRLHMRFGRGLQPASGITVHCTWTPSAGCQTTIRSPAWTSAPGCPRHGWLPVSLCLSASVPRPALPLGPCFRPWMPSLGIAPKARVPDVRPLNRSKACTAGHAAGMTPRAEKGRSAVRTLEPLDYHSTALSSRWPNRGTCMTACI